MRYRRTKGHPFGKIRNKKIITLKSELQYTEDYKTVSLYIENHAQFCTKKSHINGKKKIEKCLLNSLCVYGTNLEASLIDYLPNWHLCGPILN